MPSPFSGRSGTRLSVPRTLPHPRPKAVRKAPAFARIPADHTACRPVSKGMRRGSGLMPEGAAPCIPAAGLLRGDLRGVSLACAPPDHRVRWCGPAGVLRVPARPLKRLTPAPRSRLIAREQDRPGGRPYRGRHVLLQDLTGDPGRIRPDQPGTFMTGFTVFHRIRDHLTQKRANPSALKSADGRRRVSPVREVQGEEFARKAFAVGSGHLHVRPPGWAIHVCPRGGSGRYGRRV